MISHKNTPGICGICGSHPCQCEYREPRYRHGDKVSLMINNTQYEGHIEERMLTTWPDRRTGLFVIVDNTPVPHFPLPLKNFKENYGSIKKV